MVNQAKGTLDPFPEVTWALSQVAEARIRRQQGIIDQTPLDDPQALILAIETRGALKAASGEKLGWRQEKAA